MAKPLKGFALQELEMMQKRIGDEVENF